MGPKNPIPEAGLKAAYRNMQRRAGRQPADGALHRATSVCQGTLDS